MGMVSNVIVLVLVLLVKENKWVFMEFSSFNGDLVKMEMIFSGNVFFLFLVVVK